MKKGLKIHRNKGKQLEMYKVQFIAGTFENSNKI